MSKLQTALLVAMAAFLAACSADPNGPSLVTIVSDGGGHQLQRNGEPYFIRGAGGNWRLDLLKERSGNSIRLWSVNQKDLDAAWEQGITVLVVTHDANIANHCQRIVHLKDGEIVGEESA